MNKVTKVMLVSFIINILLSLFKVVTGLSFNSNALVADGIHSFSDLTTDVMAIMGNKLSLKPADNRHPFGHGKLEYITSLAIGLLVLFLGFKIIFNGFDHNPLNINYLVLFICLITIILKLLLSRYILTKGKLYNNSILISSGKESSADVISSIIVLISSILMLLSPYVYYFKYADIIATIIVGIFIVRVGFNILKENISSLIGEIELDEEYNNTIKNIILNNKNIIDIDKFLIMKYGSYYELICEVSINSNVSLVDAHKNIHDIEERIKLNDSRIRYVIIHINPRMCNDHV